jgi:hypothetical protein
MLQMRHLGLELLDANCTRHLMAMTTHNKTLLKHRD